MIAYSKKELFNCYVLSHAGEDFRNFKISQESMQKIEKVHACNLYTPNFFIAIALGFVTILAISFTAVLFSLIAGIDFSAGLAGLCIFMAVVSYILLELMVKSKRYFNAGIDNVLMILVLLFISGIFIIYSDDFSWIAMNAILMAVSMWLSLRFADSFMATVSFSFLFVICFLLFLEIGVSSVFYFSIAMQIIIGALYFLVIKAGKKVSFIYEKCISVLTIFLLLSFYLAGNYWVISELQSSIMYKTPVLIYGWIFWIFTVLVPIFYMVYGVVKKDLLFLRTGIMLAMIAILTYKYFFSFLPIEVEMLFLGAVLIAISYFLIKRLRPARYGFTSEMVSSRPAWRNIEGVVIAETMGGIESPARDNLMAGGGGGGAGASGDF